MPSRILLIFLFLLVQSCSDDGPGGVDASDAGGDDAGVDDGGDDNAGDGDPGTDRAADGGDGDGNGNGDVGGDDAGGGDEAGGDEAGDTDSCPPGAVCVWIPGVFHIPTVGDEVEKLKYPVPAGTYSKIVLELDVYHGGWAPDPEAVRHNIFWLVRSERNFDMYGYVNFVKPNTVLVRHGIAQVQGDKARLTQVADLSPLRTYHFVYTYDTGNMVIDSLITAEGSDVSHITHVPNVTEILFGANDTIDIHLGFTGTDNPQEPATYGWEYSNLSLIIYR